jgi:hypothetical protein
MASSSGCSIHDRSPETDESSSHPPLARFSVLIYVNGPTSEVHMIRALLLAFFLFLVFTFPATWMLMLFLGNLHTGLSYWGTLPLGILVSALLGGSASRYAPD